MDTPKLVYFDMIPVIINEFDHHTMHIVKQNKHHLFDLKELFLKFDILFKQCLITWQQERIIWIEFKKGKAFNGLSHDILCAILSFLR